MAASPRQIATIWRCATGSLPTGASSGSLRIEARKRCRCAVRASACAAAASKGVDELQADGDVLLSTVRFGNSDRSWKMTWMPSCRRLVRRQAAMRHAVHRDAPPASGAMDAGDRILISVDLPEPFSPTRQCTSPGVDRPVDAVERQRPAKALADVREPEKRSGRCGWGLPMSSVSLDLSAAPVTADCTTGCVPDREPATQPAALLPRPRGQPDGARSDDLGPLRRSIPG